MSQSPKRPDPALGDSELKIVRGYFNEDSEFIVTETLEEIEKLRAQNLRLKNALLDAQSWLNEPLTRDEISEIEDKINDALSDTTESV